MFVSIIIISVQFQAAVKDGIHLSLSEKATLTTKKAIFVLVMYSRTRAGGQKPFPRQTYIFSKISTANLSANV